MITISTTGCYFRKTQRHRTRNGAMPLFLFCNIQFYFCCLSKFFFSVSVSIFISHPIWSFSFSSNLFFTSAIFQHFSTFQYSPFSYPVIPVSPVLFFLSQTAFPVFSLLPSPSDTVPLIPDTLPTVQSCPP